MNGVYRPVCQLFSRQCSKHRSEQCSELCSRQSEEAFHAVKAPFLEDRRHKRERGKTSERKKYFLLMVRKSGEGHAWQSEFDIEGNGLTKRTQVLVFNFPSLPLARL
jgi:hypothetical protein